MKEQHDRNDNLTFPKFQYSKYTLNSLISKLYFAIRVIQKIDLKSRNWHVCLLSIKPLHNHPVLHKGRFNMVAARVFGGHGGFGEPPVQLSTTFKFANGFCGKASAYELNDDRGRGANALRTPRLFPKPNHNSQHRLSRRRFFAKLDIFANWTLLLLICVYYLDGIYL